MHVLAEKGESLTLRSGAMSPLGGSMMCVSESSHTHTDSLRLLGLSGVSAIRVVELIKPANRTRNKVHMGFTHTLSLIHIHISSYDVCMDV